MSYLNVYYRDYGKGFETFQGNVHNSLDNCERAALFELKIEPKTRLLGRWKIKRDR